MTRLCGSFAKKTVLAAAMAVLVGSTAPAALAQQQHLEGSWSGNGQIVFPSGAVENARCRANFRREAGDSYGMQAICATASARVVQNARLYRTVGNRFSGEFNNPDYGITGNIRITLTGSSMSAALEGGGGTALFRLSR